MENKQETLEEAAEGLLQSNINEVNSFIKIGAFKFGVKLGAKWQEQRMYSEEEVLEILREFYKVASLKDFPLVTTIPLWFKQFKKK
jgi:hypothetical protein